MTLDILRLDITKDLLRKMAKEERCLFLALGHASNQVNALWKLVIILTNGDADDPVKQRGPAKISFRYRQFRKSYRMAIEPVMAIGSSVRSTCGRFFDDG